MTLEEPSGSYWGIGLSVAAPPSPLWQHPLPSPPWQQVNESEVELSYVLYTDCDVLFEKDINTCSAPPPPLVMHVGGESTMESISNTGQFG